MTEHDKRSSRRASERVSRFVLVFLLSAVTTATQASPPPALVPAAATLTPAGTNLGGARIQFDSVIHDFGRILSGTTVRHDFVFTNTGEATLDVNNVAPSCGCTTAGDWSRKVEPGQRGTIPIQFNSGHFNGTIIKTITVTCNDPRQPSVSLQIRGTIWKPVEVSPETAVLNANSETAAGAKVSVRIINREESPLDLWSPENASRAFTTELRTNQPGKDYELLVGVQVPAPVGNTQGMITLKTSSTNMPVLNVNALLLLQPTVIAMPAQLNLPPAPLPNSQTLNVSIMNNGTNALVLSDAQVNAQDVGATIKETAPGRHYTLTLTFPAGFELPAGKSTELSVKTSHPQFSTIKVPIMQMPRRANSPYASAPPAVAARPPAAPAASPLQPTPAVQATKPAGIVRPMTAPQEPPPLPPG